MGSHHLRHDTTCENCGHTVEIAYCSNCGQKNVETRQSFAHLVSHFVEDFTHYDAAFWKTIKYLLFRPGRLTLEYLDGKRQRYVPPVKLYIFISFMAFFIPALLPDSTHNVSIHTYDTANAPSTEEKEPIRTDVRENTWIPDIETDEDGKVVLKNPLQYNTIREMDSVESLKPEELRLSSMEREMAKNLITRYQHSTPRQIGDRFGDPFIHNIPKAIFLYMPLFGFWLWLFHGKKRWLFFDHGIFTLHYFAFLLLCSIIMTIFVSLAKYGNSETLSAIVAFITLILLLYAIFYFYRAHRRMYKENLAVNFTKCSILFVVNITFMTIWGLIVLIYTYHNIH